MFSNLFSLTTLAAVSQAQQDLPEEYYDQNHREHYQTEHRGHYNHDADAHRHYTDEHRGYYNHEDRDQNSYDDVHHYVDDRHHHDADRYMYTDEQQYTDDHHYPDSHRESHYAEYMPHYYSDSHHSRSHDEDRHMYADEHRYAGGHHSQAPWMNLMTDANSQMSNANYPGDECCVFFADKNYRGSDSGSLCVQNYNGQTLYLMADYGLNDKVSSWWCGKSVKYKHCNNTSGSCDELNGMSGAGNIMNYEAGQDNQMSRVLLEPYNAAVQGSITTFRNQGCKGETGRFDTNKDATQPQYYTKADMWKWNVRRQSISSVMIPNGYSIALYAEDGFHGASVTMKGGSFDDLNEKMVCQEVPAEMWESTSSLSVFRTEMGQLAKGDWAHLQATEGLTFTYKVGFVSKHSDDKKFDDKYSLNMQMAGGISFLGTSTVATNFTTDIVTDTQTSQEQNIEESMTASCTAEKGQGAGLWQWMTMTAKGDSWVQSGITFCRYGKLANVKPECPWTACVDNDQCLTCRSGWQK